jgi:uncharacterized membrane protein HdeD (DUF308 family)
MSFLRTVFITIFGLAYILAGVFVLRLKPISPASINTLLGILFIAYGIFRMVRQYFGSRQVNEEQNN